MLGRRMLAIVLVCLIAVPVWGDTNLLGTTISANSTKLRGVPVIAGATVFSGDVFEVGTGGAAWLSLTDRTRLHIGPGTSAVLARSGEMVQFRLLRGSASFRTFEMNRFEVWLADARVRSLSSRPAVGIVAVLSPSKAAVIAERGALVVSTERDGKTVILREGEGVEVALAPAPASPAPPPPVAALTGVQIAIIGVAAAAVSIAAGAALSSAEPNLNQQQIQNAVSPFRP